MFICKVSLAVRCHGQRTDSFGICVLTLFLASLCLLFIVSTIRQKGIFKNICVEKFSLVVLCVVNLCYSLCYILFLNPLDFTIALHILACFWYHRCPVLVWVESLAYRRVRWWTGTKSSANTASSYQYDPAQFARRAMLGICFQKIVKRHNFHVISWKLHWWALLAWGYCILCV